MRVFVECLSGEIISDYCFKGWLGAKNAEHDVKLMSLASVSVLPNRESLKDVLPIGSVEYMTWFFTYVHEIPIPKPLHVQDYMSTGRWWSEVSTRKYVKYPCFVKPLNDIKKFTGFVAKSEKDFELYPELEDWDGPYMTSEVLYGIESEWRCFVHKKKIVNISNYKGDSTKMPDRRTLDSLIILAETKDLPTAYTIDVARLNTDECALVELNDMWAIGPYGCKEDDYFAMLKDRWNQIIYKLWN
jgi:hypothetical protein